jgi:hypothetical protein
MNFRREKDRGEPRAGPFHDRKTAASVSDADHRPIDVDAVEADQIIVIHRKADRAAVGDQLDIREPRK